MMLDWYAMIRVAGVISGRRVTSAWMWECRVPLQRALVGDSLRGIPILRLGIARLEKCV